MIFPFLLIFYTIATYLSNDMYLPALLPLMHDFNTSHQLAQMTLTAWFLGSASTQLFLGPLSDCYGRRPVLLVGGLFFIVSTVLCAMTHYMPVLLFARFIQGSAVCSLVVAGYATVHELYDSKQAIHVLALMGSIGILAPAFGPLLGGIILKVTSWRFIFWLLAVWAIIAIALLFYWMPESHPIERRHPFNIKDIFKSYLSILINKNFMLSTMTLCLIFSGLISWIATGPLLVTETFHYTPLVFGLFQAIVFGAFILGTFFVKYTINFLSKNKIIKIGVIISFFGALVSLSLSILFPSFLVAFVISLMIFAFGSAMVYVVLQRVAIEACHEPMGLRMAIFSSFLGIAGVFGSVMASVIYNGTTRVLAYFIVSIAFIAILTNRKRESCDEPK